MSDDPIQQYKRTQIGEENLVRLLREGEVEARDAVPAMIKRFRETQPKDSARIIMYGHILDAMNHGATAFVDAYKSKQENLAVEMKIVHSPYDTSYEYPNSLYAEYRGPGVGFRTFRDANSGSLGVPTSIEPVQLVDILGIDGELVQRLQDKHELGNYQVTLAGLTRLAFNHIGLDVNNGSQNERSDSNANPSSGSRPIIYTVGVKIQALNNSESSSHFYSI